MNSYTMSIEKWFGETIEFIQEAENKSDAIQKAIHNKVYLNHLHEIKTNSLKVVKKNKR